MQFSSNGTVVTLKGIKAGAMQLASKKQLSKFTKVVWKGMFTLLLTKQPSLNLDSLPLNKNLDEVQKEELQQLLDQYAMVFSMPTELPPKRGHDHHIPLKDEHQIMKVRPYRYSTIQKAEIEKMV